MLTVPFSPKKRHTRIDPEDPRSLLPHFTVGLWLELERRIRYKLVTEGQPWRHVDGVTTCKAITPELAANLAPQIVARMYKTQLAEARLTLNIAEATLRYNDYLSRQAELARVSQN